MHQSGIAGPRIQQVLRRDAGLEVSTRIALGLRSSDAAARTAIERFAEMIYRQALADEKLDDWTTATSTNTVKIAGVEVAIALRPVG